jgi:hypothetical protein
MVNINSVYLLSMDGLRCDVACIVTQVLCLFVDKITCFTKGNHQLTVSEFRNSASFDAFPPNLTVVETTSMNVICC